MVYTRGGTQGGLWREFLLLWVKRTVTGAPGLESSFLERPGNQPIGSGGAFVYKTCIVSAFSISPCIGFMVSGGPGKELKGERG